MGKAKDEANPSSLESPARPSHLKSAHKHSNAHGTHGANGTDQARSKTSKGRSGNDYLPQYALMMQDPWTPPLTQWHFSRGVATKELE
eukprot:1391299-Amphidinium_carterae.1